MKRAVLAGGVLWLYKFVILVLILGVTIVIVARHYSKQFDVRPVEAAALVDKLVACLAPKGQLEELSNYSLQACLSLDPTQLWLNFSFKEKHLEFGSSTLAKFCEAMEKGVKVKYHPWCGRVSYYLLDQAGKLGELKIELAIGKIEKNL